MKRKLNTVKVVKKLARETRIPPGRVIAPDKDKKKRQSKSDWKKEVDAQRENAGET